MLSAPASATQQRQVAGDMLQPRQVAPEVRLVVQVDVERADIEKRQLEVLGGREVHVGEQAVRRERPCASSYSSRRNRSIRAWPCQRTTDAGISLPSANISTAG